jgi:hypothetical protein
MVGDVKREMSSLSIQTAISAGNMVRRRLFNKYQMQCESVFKHILGLMIEHWDTKHLIMVVGKEQAFETAELKGADIDGGYELVTSYGTSLSLDPASRREEIMQLWPLLKEAGVSAKTILSYIKLNELSSILDRNQLASDRQRETFEEMVAKYNMGIPVYIAPEEMQDHSGMLEFAYLYVMTQTYKHLPTEVKGYIVRHINEREQLAVAAATGRQQALGVAAPAPQLQMMPGANNNFNTSLTAVPPG